VHIPPTSREAWNATEFTRAFHGLAGTEDRSAHRGSIRAAAKLGLGSSGAQVIVTSTREVREAAAKRMREAADIFNKLIGGEKLHYDGEIFQLKRGFQLDYARPATRFPSRSQRSRRVDSADRREAGEHFLLCRLIPEKDRRRLRSLPRSRRRRRLRRPDTNYFCAFQ